jgi:NAD(P)-dependent dehydrogenase (short-subunit alcohol dehydrogenase family)
MRNNLEGQKALVTGATSGIGRSTALRLRRAGAKVGLGGGAACSATKASLTARPRSWAAEFSPGGVHVNAVARRALC